MDERPPARKPPIALKLWIPGGLGALVKSSNSLRAPSGAPASPPTRPTGARGPPLLRRARSRSRPRMPARRSSTLSSAPSPFPFGRRSTGTSTGGGAHTQGLPPELWHRILRLATRVPRLDPAHADEFGLPHSEPLHVRRTKRALVRVCASWLSMATPFLYEYLAPEDCAQTRGLVDLFSRRPELGMHVRRVAFAVTDWRHDVEQHLVLVRQLLDRIPQAAAVHVLYMASHHAASEMPQRLTPSILDNKWKWRSLDWVDSTANDSLAMERLLAHCPELEQLRFTGDAVASAVLPTPTSSSRRCPSFNSLQRLTLKDVRPATLEMVSRWKMPRLSHLTLHLTPNNTNLSFLAGRLLMRYGHQLKFLRLEGSQIPQSMASLIALCPNLEELIVPCGAQLPPLPRLRKLGFVRGSNSSSVLPAYLLSLSRVSAPSLRAIAAVESTRFSLKSSDAEQLARRIGMQVDFLDFDGNLVYFTD